MSFGRSLRYDALARGSSSTEAPNLRVRSATDFGSLVAVYEPSDTAFHYSTEPDEDIPLEKPSEDMFRRLAISSPDELLALIQTSRLGLPGSLGSGLLGVAAEIAGEIEDPTKVVPVLEPLLKHQSPLVREGAVIALASYLPVTQARLEEVSREDSSPGVKAAAIEYLSDPPIR